MAQAAPYLYYAAFAAVAYTEYQSGQVEAAAHKAAAEEEKTAARAREIERREKLLRAIASRNVGSAAGGTSLEGTDIALINRDFSEFSMDQLTDSAMTSARVKSLRYAATNAKRIGTIRAAGTLFQMGAAAASSFKPSSSTKSLGGIGAGSGTLPAPGAARVA